MKKAVLLTLTLFASFAFAKEGTVANGGDAVVCRDSSEDIVSVRLLDFYEIEKNFNFDIKKLEARTLPEAVVELLERFKYFDTYPHSILLKMANEFTSEAKFLSGVELVDIPDSEHTFFPKGCKVEQVAIYKNPKIKNQKRYTVNQDLWDKMELTDKAGLILHEILYRLYKPSSSSSKNSIKVRYIVGLIGADQLKTLTYKEYLEIMYRSFGIGLSNYKGHLIRNPMVDSKGMLYAYDIFIENDGVYTLPNGVEVKVNKESRIQVNHKSIYY